MPISTTISIQIGDEKLPRFSKLMINQKVNTHHKFSLLQPLPKEFVSQAIDKSQGYIGQEIKIEISPKTMTTDAPFVFNGIVSLFDKLTLGLILCLEYFPVISFIISENDLLV